MFTFSTYSVLNIEYFGHATFRAYLLPSRPCNAQKTGKNNQLVGSRRETIAAQRIARREAQKKHGHHGGRRWPKNQFIQQSTIIFVYRYVLWSR
jgi:hypothetical protein